MQTRRQFVSAAVSAAVGAGAALMLPRFALAEFPPQSAIDNDPLRPRYHLMPVRGWMNDPCAPVYFNERYHLFFQYNPGASVWGDMHWAHAVSKDMVHWTHRPVALAPTPGGPDAYGVFTGTMVMDHGSGAGAVPTVLYTCVSPSSAAEATLWGAKPPEREQQCLATPARGAGSDRDATLDVWNKLATPVITTPPEGMKVTGFRDPVPWQEEDGAYYMLLASGEKGKGGNVLLYKSADLRQWQFQHVFAEGKWTGKVTDDTVDSGEMWECPDFFPLGGKHVLIHSTGTPDGRKTLWQSGTLDKRTMRWTPEHEGVLNHGPYYAPKTQADADGNRVLWGWIPENRTEAEFAKAGWAGCMSLPRALTLEEGQLRFAPAKQVEGLRGAVSLEAGSNRGESQAEFVFRARQSTNANSGPRRKPYRFQSTAMILEIGLLPTPGPPVRETAIQWNGVTLPLRKAFPADIEIRCFLDHSVLEVFVGDSLVLTHRAYGGAAAELRLSDDFEITSSRSYIVAAI